MVLIGYSSYAQINYENGYFINNNGNRSSVLIMNVDWRNNPSVINYKTSPNAKEQTISVKDIQEFGIGENLQYKRFTMDVDQSSDNINSLSLDRNPEFEEQTLLLKVLLEGEASLFQYTDQVKNRFFYSLNGSPVQQLVYKQYQSSNGMQRGKNNYFRQQLLNEFKCEDIHSRDVERLSYSKNALLSFFKKYNRCVGSDFVDHENTGEVKGGFNFKVKAGVDYTTFKIIKEGNFQTISRTIEFDNTLNPRFGLELEYILPFNKNKWGVFVEPSYQQLEVEKDYVYYKELPNYGTTAHFSTKMIALPLGFRHYLFLSDNSKLYLNGAYVLKFFFDNQGKSDEFYENEDVEFVKRKHNLEFGAGYTLNNKYSLEVKYGTGHDFFAGQSKWNVDKSNVISIMLGYTIF